LRLADAVGGEVAPAFVTLHLEIQHRTGGAPSLTFAAAQDAAAAFVAALVGHAEDELDFQPFLAVIDEVFVPPVRRARPPPHGPGDRVEQRGLAHPVLPDQTSKVNPTQVQIGLAVGEKITEVQFFRNHG